MQKNSQSSHTVPLTGPLKRQQGETADGFSECTFDFEGVGLDVLAGRGHSDHVEGKFAL